MESKKRKPFSDITNTYNLIPTSTLRKLVAASSNSNFPSKPPISILKSISSSRTHKLCPESSNRSDASVGSSNIIAARNSRTVQFQTPLRANSSIANKGFVGNKDAAAGDKRESTEKSQRKDKGKAIDEPYVSSPRKTMKDNHIRNCNPLNPLDQDLHIEFTEKSKGEREAADADLIIGPAPVERRMDKGKSIAETYVSSPSKIGKDNQISICIPFNSLEKKMQQDEANLGNFRGGLTERMQESGKQTLKTYNHSYEKTKKGKEVLNSSGGSVGKQEGRDKGIANDSSCLRNRRNCGKKGIVEASGSSIMKAIETGKEIVTPSSSLIERRKRKGKAPDLFGSLPEKTGDKREQLSDSLGVKCQPPKGKGKKGKTDAKALSCPAMRRTKNTLDGFDEIEDVKSSSTSCSDPRPTHRKRRCSKDENSGELALDFIEQQKAYFKEIDEFELVEEEASAQDLE